MDPAAKPEPVSNIPEEIPTVLETTTKDVPEVSVPKVIEPNPARLRTPPFMEIVPVPKTLPPVAVVLTVPPLTPEV